MVMTHNTEKTSRDSVLAGLGVGIVAGASEISEFTVSVETVQTTVTTSMTTVAQTTDSLYDLSVATTAVEEAVSTILITSSSSSVTSSTSTELAAANSTSTSNSSTASTTTSSVETSTTPVGSTITSSTTTSNTSTTSTTSVVTSPAPVATPANCSINGQTIAHGSSVTRYQNASVPFGSACSSETRSCSDGVLSGSYSNQSCSVEAARTCSFNGQTIPHDGIVTAYLEDSVAFDSTCSSEIRSCNDGVLGGSYTKDSCVVHEKPEDTNSESTAATPVGVDWIQQLGTPADDVTNSITLDSSGNIYVTGYTRGDLEENTNTGESDIILVKYDQSGTRQWSQQFGTAGFDGGNDISTDSLGNVYITGYIAEEFQNGFLVKYDSEGIEQWSDQIEHLRMMLVLILEEGAFVTPQESGNGVAIDTLDNIYVTGYTEGELGDNTNAGGSDLFLIKYSSDGSREWTQQIGSSANEYGIAVATDSSNNIYITGFTGGDLDGNTNAGGEDFS